jgi:hypothetical protein
MNIKKVKLFIFIKSFLLLKNEIIIGFIYFKWLHFCKNNKKKKKISCLLEQYKDKKFLLYNRKIKIKSKLKWGYSFLFLWKW